MITQSKMRMDFLDECKKDIESIKSKMNDLQFENFLIYVAEFVDNTNCIIAISNFINLSNRTVKEDIYSELNKSIFKADEAFHSLKEILKEINY